jgi:hypothetical protein
VHSCGCWIPPTHAAGPQATMALLDCTACSGGSGAMRVPCAHGLNRDLTARGLPAAPRMLGWGRR